MAGPVHVLDDYYLSITLLITVAYQLFFFSIAFSFKFDKLTGGHFPLFRPPLPSLANPHPDFAGGTNFAVLAVVTLAFSGQPDARQLVASLCLAVWALRLAGFLLFRVLRTGKDDRFDDKRDRFFPFLGFWVFQMLWVWAVSLPVTVLNSPAVRRYHPQAPFGTARDIAGLVLFALGLGLETVSDAQKFAFRQRHDRAAICDAGVFAWSRHPNYFGEIIIQFGRPSLRPCPHPFRIRRAWC